MSTQDSSGTFFAICNQQQNLRFLELPPSLLEVIQSQGAPNLELKSTATQSSGTLDDAPANAVLCTSNKTFKVRQVQSSNSVFVLQPISTTQASKDDSLPSTSLSAIAQCPVTLELVPTSPSALSFVRKSIPAYPGAELGLSSDSSETRNRNAVLESCPFSSGEFDNAWKELCCFEQSALAWRPSASTLVGIWKSILSASILRCLSFDDKLPMNKLESIIEEDNFPDSLLRAVINRLTSAHTESSDGPLDKDLTVFWVGTVLLESQQITRDSVLLSEFLQEWRDILPEGWKEYAHLDVLKGKYLQVSENQITYNAEASENIVTADISIAKSSTKNARKWHEKFKNARR
ncbi:hypothetical protein ACLMJK_003558 [Lecanora helva]